MTPTTLPPARRWSVISALGIVQIFAWGSSCYLSAVFYTRLRRWAEAGVLDRLFAALQEHRLIQIRVECLGLDSTSVKVHPDGTGAPKKWGLKPSEGLGADETPRFIWLPRMQEQP